MSEKYLDLKKNALKETSELEMTASIPAEAILSHRKKALKELSETVNIPGFRKGHIPEKVLVEKLGEMHILEEAAELALKDIIPGLVEEHAPMYIGRPNISITKLVPGQPVEFKLVIAVRPEFKLPDYKKIAKDEMSQKVEVSEVTDKEVADVIEEMRKKYAHNEFHKDEANKDSHDHKHEDVDLEKYKPEFNDEFVKSIGNFKDVEDFKVKARENILKEKNQRAIEKKRIKLLEKLVAETEVVVPRNLTDIELNRMFGQFEADIASLGLKVEDYLKHIKKTPEDLQKEWLPDAEKRAKLNLILESIAFDEKIVPPQDMVEQEIKHIKEHYKDVDEARVQLYVLQTLTIEQTIKFLEDQK